MSEIQKKAASVFAIKPKKRVNFHMISYHLMTMLEGELY